MKSFVVAVVLLGCALTAWSAADGVFDRTGAEVRNNFNSRSEYYADSGILEKCNSEGVTVWRSLPVPVKPGQQYIGTMEVEILQRNFGALASFRLVYLNQDGGEIGGIGELNPSYQRLYGVGGTRGLSRISSATHGAAAMRLELRLGGNPSKIRIGEVAIHPYQTEPLFRGVYSPKSRIADRDATLARLREIRPSEVRVVSRHGRTFPELDGKIVSLKSYKGSIDYGPLAKAGANLIITFNSGTTLFWSKRNWDPSTTRPDGTFDFTRLENELLLIHEQAPDVRVLLNIQIDPGEAFFQEHPDSIFRDEAGRLGIHQLGAFAGFESDKVPGPNPARNRHFAVSYASAAYRRHVENGLKEVIDFLHTSSVGNIVAGFCFNGGHDDQFLQWEYSQARGQFDYSPASVAAFRLYLKEKYQTDNALRTAWEDPQITLDSARPFSEKEWESRSWWCDGPPGLPRRILDGREFLSISIAQLQCRLAKFIHEQWKRPCLVGTYYSSPIWPQAGRSTLDELVRGGAINLVYQVSHYSTMRRLGGIGGSANFSIAALQLRDTLFMQEMDYRTPRTQITRGWDQKQAAEPRDAEEFCEQIRRDAGSVLAYGGNGFFYFDMFDSWYNDPKLLSAIAETYRAADWQVKYGGQLPRTRVAVFLDERSTLLLMSPSNNQSLYAVWRMSGLTPDVYLLNDLCNSALPDYRFYIVPSALTLTSAQAEALRRKACKPGHVLLLTGATGALTDRKNPGTVMRTLADFGLHCASHSGAVEDVSEYFPPETDPLLKNCNGFAGIDNLRIVGNQTKADQHLFFTSIDDPEAKILARWHNSGLPSLAVKRSPTTGTLIYSAQFDGISPQFLYNAAQEAGILPYITAPGNSVSVGCGVAALHRTDQPIVLQFTEPMEFFDAATGEKIGEGRTLSVPCGPWESRLILYRKASSATPSATSRNSPISITTTI